MKDRQLKSKKALITFGLVCCLITNNCAASYNDTTQRKKPYKISQKEFLYQYGKDDDTAKAIINHYFKQRKHAAGLLVFNASAAAFSGLVAFLLGENILGLLFALGAAAAIFGVMISIPLVIYVWLHFSRNVYGMI